MDKDLLKKWIRKNLFNSSEKINNRRIMTNSNFYKDNKDIFKEIESMFDLDISLLEKIYLIMNDLNYPPVCKICSSQVKFFNYTRGYQTYCSIQCQHKDDKVKQKCKDTKLKRYGDPNYNNMKRHRKTMMERYGVDHNFKCIEIREKIKETKKIKYGNPNFNNREKAKVTVKNIYGVENISQVKEIKEKKRQTYLKKYGVSNPTQCKNIIKKIIQTNIIKYGTEYPRQKNIEHYDEWIDGGKFIEIYNRLESVEDIANYFNIQSTSNVHKRARNLNLPYKPRRKDVTIKKIGQTIESYGYEVEYNNRSIIKPLEIDIIISKKYNDKKYLEYNGLWYHSIGLSSIPVFDNYKLYLENPSKYIDKDRIKLDRCRQLGIELFVLREDIYLNDNSIIDKWLNNQLKYKILDQPVIYRFKTFNDLEIISKKDIELSIKDGFRIYFDWIEIYE